MILLDQTVRDWFRKLDQQHLVVIDNINLWKAVAKPQSHPGGAEFAVHLVDYLEAMPIFIQGRGEVHGKLPLSGPCGEPAGARTVPGLYP